MLSRITLHLLLCHLIYSSYLYLPSRADDEELSCPAPEGFQASPGCNKTLIEEWDPYETLETIPCNDFEDCPQDSDLDELKDETPNCELSRDCSNGWSRTYLYCGTSGYCRKWRKSCRNWSLSSSDGLETIFIGSHYCQTKKDCRFERQTETWDKERGHLERKRVKHLER